MIVCRFERHQRPDASPEFAMPVGMQLLQLTLQTLVIRDEDIDMSASFLPLAWHKPAAHRALSHAPLHTLLHLLGFTDLHCSLITGKYKGHQRSRITRPTLLLLLRKHLESSLRSSSLINSLKMLILQSILSTSRRQ